MQYSTIILALATSATAHIKLNWPVPFGNNPDNFPLDDSGSNFPCKATGPEYYTIKQMNQWNAGETKTVSFKGSATHGGGSCQFSLTTDPQPSKKSQWKVIHSIVGGCITDESGNLEIPGKPEGDPENTGNGLKSHDVTLPANLPAGQYTFSWSWLNRVGNREFYMMCAPITVGGGIQARAAAAQDVSSVLGNLPDMFVTNLPRTQCSTLENFDIAYPDAGQSVEFGSDKSKQKFAMNPNIASGCAAALALGKGDGQLGTPSKPSDSTPTQGGVFAPGASGGPTPSPTPSPVIEKPVAQQPTENAPTTNPPYAGPPSTTTPTTGAQGEACPTDGAVFCLPNNQWGMCDHGFAVPQALASGTVCKDGVISAIISRRARSPRSVTRRQLRYPGRSL